MRLRFWEREPGDIERSGSPLAFDDWATFMFNGRSYPFGGINQTMKGDREEIAQDFAGLVQGAYKQNGIVFACMYARARLFCEARFQWRQLRSGKPGDMFGDKALLPLEKPWPGGTTRKLLKRMIQDADIAGNWFACRRPNDRVKRMRPDWTSFILGSEEDPDVQAGDIDAEVLGYLYFPGGPGSGRDPMIFAREEVSHFAPIPDPVASYRGMSWLTPVLREITGDSAATSHKIKFFENGATPNMAWTSDITDPEKFKKWVDLFRSQHEGVANAYKTIFLGAGVTPVPVGSNFEQMDYKVVQGAGETRIAAAAGVPPIIVGLSEGLDAATYSNYGQARRAFADGTMRDLWGDMAGSMENIVDVPAAAELWYDDKDISFLQEDVKDAIESQAKQSQTIRTLVDAGFEADSVISAVNAGDWRLLKHSGLFSVQLQPPGTKDEPEPDEEANPNGAPSEDIATQAKEILEGAKA